MTPPPPLLFISLLTSLSNLSGIEAFAPWRGSSLLSHESYLSSNSLQCRGPTTTNRHHDGVALLSHEEQSRNNDIETPTFSSPSNRSSPSRRAILQSATASLVTLTTAKPAFCLPTNPFAPPPPQPFRPSSRCTAYLVDSTIPPSLIPYRASREASILKNLGMGSGTSKEPFSRDEVNLNNFMNKAVFGAIDATKEAFKGISNVVGGEKKVDRYASFVFLGANFDAESPTARGNANADAELAVGLMKDICRPEERNGNTAIGVAFVPISAQSALDEYVVGSGGEAASLDRLMAALKAAGVDPYLAERHIPIFQFAQEKNFPLLALSPELQDLDVIRNKGGGLQSLDPQRRELYVADAEGFIALTRDPKFKLYTEKSLLKDFTPSSPTISEEAFKTEQANFFAERILVHEAAATVIANWAAPRPNSLVITLTPISDVRFMGGINGRVPRVYRFLNGDKSGEDEGRGVGEDAVTTILLNPSAQETLSESRFLRLEIGTAPNNWAYQTKIADYFWFSSMPKVNMLPRMMNEQ